MHYRYICGSRSKEVIGMNEVLTLFGAVANIFLTWLLLIREKKN